jgi:hypothetical protein
MDPPFDGKSELVTANNPTELVSAISDFMNDHERFKPFLRKDVMEKYIGPLDGRNLERNLNYVYELLNIPREVATT